MNAKKTENLIEFSPEKRSGQKNGEDKGISESNENLSSVIRNTSIGQSIRHTDCIPSKSASFSEKDPFHCPEKSARLDISEMVKNSTLINKLNENSNVQAENLSGVAELKNSDHRMSNMLSVSSNPRAGSYSSLFSENSPNNGFDESISVISPIYPLADQSSHNKKSMTFNKGILAETSSQSIACPSANEDLTSTFSSLDKARFINSRDLRDTSTHSQQIKTKSESEIENKNLTASGKKQPRLRTGSLDISATTSPVISLRTQLLKLSLSNSLNLNSPLRRKDRISSSSQENSVFCETSNIAERLAQIINNTPGSPRLSDISCDDLMNWVDSETDIDSDLEMLKIPILEEIEKMKLETENTRPLDPLLLKKLKEQKEVMLETKLMEDSGQAQQLKNAEIEVTEDDENIDQLLDNLKRVILNCSNEQIKCKANNLIDSISTALHSEAEGTLTSEDSQDAYIPASISRQVTFDLEKPTVSPSMHIDSEPVTPELGNRSSTGNIVEQIGKMLGKQNVSVLETNLNGAVGNANTYIVVVGTPLPATSDSYKECTKVSIPTHMRNRRSLSVSIHDKPKPSFGAKINQAHQSNPVRHLAPLGSLATPVRPSSTLGHRRNSMNFSPNVRRSIYAQNQSPNEPNPINRGRPANGSSSQHIPTKKTVAANQIRHPVRIKANDFSNGAVSRKNGPLKATIPIKRVAPMIVTPSVSSPIADDKKRKLATRTQTDQKVPSKLYPSACSTPAPNNSQAADRKSALAYSPISNLSMNAKSRYSTTPNFKTSLGVGGTNINHRRTMSGDSRSPSKKNISGHLKLPQMRSLKLPQKVDMLVSSAAKRLMGKSSRISSVSSNRSDQQLQIDKENKVPR